MHLHIFQHVPFETPAGLETWAQKHGHTMTVTPFFHAHTLPEHDSYDWLAILGGPMSVHDERKYPWLTEEKRYIESAIDRKKIVLGICLGAQLITDVLGGTVYRNRHHEIGWFPIETNGAAASSVLFKSLPRHCEVFHWHSDTFTIPDGCIKTAWSEATENQAFECNNHVFALQFHLESTRESISSLIAESRNDIHQDTFVQTPDEMLALPDRFESLHRHMMSFLASIEHINQDHIVSDDNLEDN